MGVVGVVKSSRPGGDNTSAAVVGLSGDSVACIRLINAGDGVAVSAEARKTNGLVGTTDQSQTGLPTANHNVGGWLRDRAAGIDDPERAYGRATPLRHSSAPAARISGPSAAHYRPKAGERVTRAQWCG